MVDLKSVPKNKIKQWVVFGLNGKGIIENFIEYKITSGHCKNHQIFYIKEVDEIIFSGSGTPQMQQMNIEFLTYYDAKSVETYSNHGKKKTL